MINSFESLLTGGHPNSLGNTEQVVNIILKDQSKLQALYDCYKSEDEVVRLRVSSAFKRITKAKPAWMDAYIDRFINEISIINQPSAQWTFAQILLWLDDRLSNDQRNRAIKALQRNLKTTDDWIALNTTMETLTKHAKDEDALKAWLTPHLEKLSKDTRKSVAKRANKYLGELSR